MQIRAPDGSSEAARGGAAMLDKEEAIVAFLLREWKAHRQSRAGRFSPLLVGLQGPQGSGSYIAALTQENRIRRRASLRTWPRFSLLCA